MISSLKATTGVVSHNPPVKNPPGAPVTKVQEEGSSLPMGCKALHEPLKGGKTPKMDGENHGKPYEQMDDLGGFPIIFGLTPIPSLKLTASLHLKMDGRNTFSFPFGVSAYFQVRTVSFREGSTIHLCWVLPEHWKTSGVFEG